MKRIITLFCFAVLFSFGTENLSAQKKATNQELSVDKSFEDVVNSKCEALKGLLNLSEKQEHAIMEVLRITEPKKAKIQGENYEDKAQAKKDLQSVLDYEMEQFKNILNESQFKLYSDSLKKKW